MVTMTDDLDLCGPPVFVLRSPLLKGFRVECRPIERHPPPSCSVSIMYRREGDCLLQVGVGALVDGKWTNGKGKDLDPEGLHWTAMVDERP